MFKLKWVKITKSKLINKIKYIRIVIIDKQINIKIKIIKNNKN